MIKTKMNTEDDELMKIDSRLFTYNTNSGEINHLLSIDPDVFTYDIVVQESYEEIVYKCSLIAQEINKGLRSNLTSTKKNYIGVPPFLARKKEYKKYRHHAAPLRKNVTFGEVSETARDKILRDHWRKRFRNEYDDNKEFEDPDGCGENKENEIIGTILNKLHDEWFKGTDEDDDDLEGIIDYLKPTLYDGFVDSDNEEYKERKCR
ncbi:hypothetical protein Tco_0649622 [Tanacetum coccineum]